jgi:hypothetical protein
VTSSGPRLWNVVPSQRYTEHLEEAAQSEPRLREVLDGLCIELERAPFQTDRCDPLGDEPTNKYWMLLSNPEHSGAPHVLLIFSVWNLTITLEDFRSETVDSWIEKMLSG